jgi:hypothetical protein
LYHAAWQLYSSPASLFILITRFAVVQYICCWFAAYPGASTLLDGVLQHVLLAAAVTQQRCTAVHLPLCTEYCRCRVVDNVLHAWHVVLLGLL